MKGKGVKALLSLKSGSGKLQKSIHLLREPPRGLWSCCHPAGRSCHTPRIYRALGR